MALLSFIIIIAECITIEFHFIQTCLAGFSWMSVCDLMSINSVCSQEKGSCLLSSDGYLCLKMTTKRNLFVRLVPCRCLRGEEETVTSLDYSHCSLEQVPKEIFTFEKTLEELYLDANQIEELPKQLFNCQSLNKLSLPDNDLTILPASIANLINLRELDVSKNGIQEFPENIKNCKVLTIVEASVNPISKLPDGFSQLLNLTQLYLNDAFLDFLPANFGRLTKLQILELRENQLKMLPKTMNRLTQLERLDLGSNEFTEVPEVLEQLSGLKEFWMDGNRLTYIPGFLGSLKQLTYLDLSKNNIEMVEDGIAGCESLQDLLLSSNAIQQLPESIGALKKLTTLKVDENQLMYLPDSIGGLVSLEELDCSFNEVEALPSSIGQFSQIRTFAADHNFLIHLPPEIGAWKNTTVLFLHSNKLESLPEEMADMQKLKVINLSDNKLKNLPFSFTRLQQLTAMWLSDNQSKPLIPLQKETDPDSQKTVLTNYMFPQQPRTDDVIFSSDNESFNPSLWEEQRKQRAQVAFECDEDKDEREVPAREGNLKRYPTPYPDELKNMVKTVQTIVHRLKEEEKGEGANKEPKNEVQPLLKETAVKTLESAPTKPEDEEKERLLVGNCMQKASDPETQKSIENSQPNNLVKNVWNAKTIVNHDETLEQESEDLSCDEEMKMAEMRPPLIETSMNQPKVVALSNNKKGAWKDHPNRTPTNCQYDIKDADSLSDEITQNSNQNNSNCSSPSRMSDSVSLNTVSSHDTSLCSPEKESRIATSIKLRQEDENFNNLLHNGGKLNAVGERQITEIPSLDSEENLVQERRVNNTDKPHNLNQININNNLTNDESLHSDTPKRQHISQQLRSGEAFLNNNEKREAKPLENRKPYPNMCAMNKVNGHSADEDMSPDMSEPVRSASEDSVPSFDMCVSKSTDDLSPQMGEPVGHVVKSHSITNIEMGELRIYDILSDSGSPQSSYVGKMALASAEGQNIVRSKSATLLYDQPLQVFSGSSSSSDLVSTGKKNVFKFDSNHNPEGTYSMRGPPGSQMSAVPQYNVQYSSSSAAAKDNLWNQKQMASMDQGALPSPRFHLSDSVDSPSYIKHSANMNFSNHNNVRASNMYGVHQRMGPRHVEAWAMSQNDRLHQGLSRNTLQRQGSVSSNASMSLGDAGPARRVVVPEGDYMTYRDIHSMGRPSHLIPGPQRPLSARTYSIDGPNVPRPQSARPSVNDIPERTMSVSDFNYSRTSPKKPNARVSSEHSLLDPPGRGKVPHDWREQVLRHIEAKKIEKHPTTGSTGEPAQDDVFGPGQQNYATLLHKENSTDGAKKMHMSNGQMCPPSRAQSNYSQLHHHSAQPSMVRIRLIKDPELGFSISGGVGGRGNPFRPGDDGIYVTRVQPEGPASKLLQPGDKIVQANGYSFLNIDHGQAVSLLKKFQGAVELIVLRDGAV
ncbi:erbin isoform X3 [Rana temporaria]|uniref:erbin isoform X3 n=1 Tax=Rana temporaria TaxID=8407 RepID=UPI001AAC93D7|nr:erbin isoform X3 [Rana temporaria]